MTAPTRDEIERLINGLGYLSDVISDAGFHKAAEYMLEAAAELRRLHEQPGLVAALEESLEQAEGCWTNHYGDNPEGSAVPHHITQARAALRRLAGEGEGE